MNAPIDTLAFAEKFEGAGFGHDQARALAAAFGQAQEAGREGLATKPHLDAKLAEVRADLADLKAEVRADLADMKVELVREISTVSKDVTGRLWSTITIIAGVATAISATIGAGVALILKWGGL